MTYPDTYEDNYNAKKTNKVVLFMMQFQTTKIKQQEILVT